MAAAKGATGKRGGDGKALQVWQDYVAGTDPTNAAAVFSAGIEFVDGVPQVTWSPNLNTNGEVRTYTIWGKTNLMDAAWHSRGSLRSLRARFARLPFEAKLLRRITNAADRLRRNA